MGLGSIGFVTGVSYKQRGLGAEFGAKFSALIGGIVTIIGFFVFLQNAEASGGVLFNLLLATFFYGPMGAGNRPEKGHHRGPDFAS